MSWKPSDPFNLPEELDNCCNCDRPLDDHSFGWCREELQELEDGEFDELARKQK